MVNPALMVRLTPQFSNSYNLLTPAAFKASTAGNPVGILENTLTLGKIGMMWQLNDERISIR